MNDRQWHVLASEKEQNHSRYIFKIFIRLHDLVVVITIVWFCRLSLILCYSYFPGPVTCEPCFDSLPTVIHHSVVIHFPSPFPSPFPPLPLSLPFSPLPRLFGINGNWCDLVFREGFQVKGAGCTGRKIQHDTFVQFVIVCSAQVVYRNISSIFWFCFF